MELLRGRLQGVNESCPCGESSAKLKNPSTLPGGESPRHHVMSCRGRGKAISDLQVIRGGSPWIQRSTQVTLEIGTPWMSHSRLGCPTPWISKASKETSCPRGCLDNSLSLGCLLPPLDILCPLVKQGGVGCLTRVDIPLKHWMSKRLGYPTLYWMSKHAGYPTVVPDVQACGLSHIVPDVQARQHM